MWENPQLLSRIQILLLGDQSMLLLGVNELAFLNSLVTSYHTNRACPPTWNQMPPLYISLQRSRCIGRNNAVLMFDVKRDRMLHSNFDIDRNFVVLPSNASLNDFSLPEIGGEQTVHSHRYVFNKASAYHQTVYQLPRRRRNRGRPMSTNSPAQRTYLPVTSLRAEMEFYLPRQPQM